MRLFGGTVQGLSKRDEVFSRSAKISVDLAVRTVNRKLTQCVRQPFLTEKVLHVWPNSGGLCSKNNVPQN